MCIFHMNKNSIDTLMYILKVESRVCTLNLSKNSF